MGMKVLYWNVHITRPVDEVMAELRKLISETNPEVVGLGEGSNVLGRADNIHGYQAFYLDEEWRGKGGTIVLVRDDVNLRKYKWVNFTQWWYLRKGGNHQGPKRFWNGRIKDEHLGVVRLSVGHWPFNAALPEVEKWAVDWFNKPVVPKRISVHLGDLNMGKEETERFVKQFKGKTTGINIDRAMFKNCTVTARDLGHRGSDHPAVLFRITK